MLNFIAKNITEDMYNNNNIHGGKMVYYFPHYIKTLSDFVFRLTQYIVITYTNSTNVMQHFIS